MEGRVGINVLTQVGHSAVRRFVMGEEVTRVTVFANERRVGDVPLEGPDDKGRRMFTVGVQPLLHGSRDL